MAAPSTETRAQRQGRIDTRVAELRARAATKQATADRIFAASNQDHAFWAQPACGNAAGRAFARHRDRERNRLAKAASLAAEATELRERADALAARGAVVAGDAKSAREAQIAVCDVSVGDMVDTAHFGLRRVLKVNTKTVLVEGSFGPLKVEKQYVRRAA